MRVAREARGALREISSLAKLRQLSWLVAVSVATVVFGVAGGCGGGSKKHGAQGEPVPDASTDALDDLGEPTPSVTMAFGRACSKGADCGLELDCIDANSSKLARGGPPRGLCTTSCRDNPEACRELADDALCIDFGDDSFCVEGCEYGTPDPMAFDREKCHGRREFVCRPVLLEGKGSCDEDDDCDPDEACSGETCHPAVTACMPQCNGDFDCPAGRFCDPKTGECIDDVPGGRQLGESCRPDADDCRGVCAQVGGASDWRCAEPCTLGVYPSCGSPTDPAEVGCAVLSGLDASFGDLGWCARLCDCNDDCPVGRQCVTVDREYLGRPGYCGVPSADSVVRATCPDEGSGGSSGTGGSTSGSGGTGGGAGSPGSAGQAGERSH